MSINRIGFKGTDNQIKPQETKTQTQPIKLEQVDEEKSNATKYMIGATAVASVIALGVLGYKGKLGDGIQKLLGGVKKESDNLDNIAKPKNSDSKTKSGDSESNSGTNNAEVPNKNTKRTAESSEVESPTKTTNRQESEPASPPQPEVPTEQPKVDLSLVGTSKEPGISLTGTDLVKSNLKRIPEQDGDSLGRLCYNTQSEINKLSGVERLKYIQEYLDQLKTVDIKKFDNQNELFSDLISLSHSNKDTTEMLIKFAKENPDYQPSVISDIIRATTSMYSETRGDEAKRKMCANIIDTLAQSGLKHTPGEKFGGLRLYAREWSTYDSAMKNPSEVSNSRKYFFLKCKKLDLALGMDKHYIKGILEDMQEYPEYYKTVLNVNESNKGKFLQELKDSYKRLTGENIDFDELAKTDLK